MRSSSPSRRWNRTPPTRVTSWKCAASGSKPGEMHVKNGQKLRNAGKLAEALAEFEKAYGIDPASDIAMQEIKRTQGDDPSEIRIAADNPARAAAIPKEEDKTLTPSELAHKRAQERTDSLLPIPELRPLNTDLIDLKMTNQRPRILFETVAKLAGINVLFDPEYDHAADDPGAIDRSVAHHARSGARSDFDCHEILLEAAFGEHDFRHRG